MRRPYKWLHVFLSLALVLNGIAAAQASTRMLMQHTSAAEMPVQVRRAPAPVLASQPPPCHERTAMVSPAAPTSPIAKVDDSSTNIRPCTDCCKSAACSCECLPQFQAMPATTIVAGPHVAHFPDVRAMASTHPEAALPNLIRPPII